MLITTVIIVILATIGSLLIAPIYLCRLPEDYLTSQYKRSNNIFHIIIRNILGIVLIIIGIVLLFMPGQGLLTMVMGLLLCDYPKKRAIESYILKLPKVYQAVNWVRNKAKKAPLKLD